MGKGLVAVQIEVIPPESSWCCRWAAHTICNHLQNIKWVHNTCRPWYL